MSRYFLTGGTGTLSQELVRQLWEDAKRIVVFSRGEHKQVEMAKKYPEYPKNTIRYVIGDIRDKNRLTKAMAGCEYVIHTAALKHVPVCEYNPQEAIATNIIGTQNVIEACHAAGIKKCIVVSTDKSVEPITLYGATKMCMERIAVSGNNLGSCRFSVVRYANVYGSNGSVIQSWQKQLDRDEPMTITDSRMTRMWIDVKDAASFIINRFHSMEGGEIFVPKCKSTSIMDMAKKCSVDNRKEFKVKETGLRPAEKLHEILISESDARDCWQMPSGDYYIIYPPIHDWTVDFQRKGTKQPETFRMASNG